jgi:hypothetical protein
MISLVCSNCQSSFEIDDGFAGGVCRCAACGTIQTVPTKEQIARGEADGASNVIFKRPDASNDTSRTLEQLSDAVTGSGLAGSGLHHRAGARPARGASADAAKSNDAASKAKWAFVAAGVCAAVAAIALVYAMTRSGSGTTKAPVVDPAVDLGKTPSTQNPRFAEIELPGSSTVIFLVDRGDATRNMLTDIRRLILRDLATLGATRRYQVIFWAQGDDVLAIPDSPLTASQINIDQLSTQWSDIPQGRSTQIGSSLSRALASSPSDVVVITGKGWQLDDAFADEVLGLRKQSSVRIHSVSIGDDSAPLRKIAETTGGAYRVYSADRFKQLGR